MMGRGESSLRMHPRAIAFLTLVALVALAGCTAEGAGTGNFTLAPQRVGWYAGDEAQFALNISSSFLNSEPSFTLDRHFAIEEIQLVEKGLKFGGDFETKDPNEISLALSRNGTNEGNFILDAAHPGVDLTLRLPADLRDSEYALELKLFKVGWVKSDRFRVDHR